MSKYERSSDDRRIMIASAERALGRAERKNPSDVRKEAAVTRKLTRTERK